MSERENKIPVTTEEWSDHISEFSHKWENGTPEHYAVNDFYNLQKLYGEIGQEPKSELAKVSGEANLSTEQRATLTLQRVALLEHTIEQNKAHIKGYSSAYLEMSTSFQNLISAASQDGRSKFPNEEENQTAYIKQIYQETLDYVVDNIFAKQNSNR